MAVIMIMLLMMNVWRYQQSCHFFAVLDAFALFTQPSKSFSKAVREQVLKYEKRSTRIAVIIYHFSRGLALLHHILSATPTYAINNSAYVP